MVSFDKIINATRVEKFLEVGFPLVEAAIKPIFLSFENENNSEFSCMLDTGASIPVWCAGDKLFKEILPRAKLQERTKYILGGFGSGFEVADVYYVPAMVLNNGDHSIVFNRAYLPVVNKNRFGANLILPSSFFKNANIVISQLQTLTEKQLIFQCHNPWYIMKFTKVRVNADAVGLLEGGYGITGISDGEDILGVEREFNDALVQFSTIAKTIEDFPEDGQGQDTEAAPLNIFGCGSEKE